LPSFHFGIIVDAKTWQDIYSKLKEQRLDLVTEFTFLEGKVGEHSSFFVKAPNDYMLEFKSFKNSTDVFNS
jgi:extradiol dioxygenase family protein